MKIPFSKRAIVAAIASGYLFSKLQAKKPAVTMGFAGDHEVIKNLLLKKRLLKENNLQHEKIRTLLILPPGIMLGSIQAGAVTGLEKVGLIPAFDTILGVSSGSVVAYYAIAGEIAVGTSIIFDDMVRDHFIDVSRVRSLVDLDSFENTMRSVKPISTETLKKARPEFYAGTTDIKSGKGILVDVKKSPDPLSVIIASCCIPVVTGGRRSTVGEHICLDGGLAFPMPITEGIKRFTPTDVLIISGKGLEEERPLPLYTDVAMKKIFSEGVLPQVIADLIVGRHMVINQELAYFMGKRKAPDGVRLGIIYPAKSQVSPVTLNPDLLQKAVLLAKRYVEELFTE